jgi:hypothetical protein
MYVRLYSALGRHKERPEVYSDVTSLSPCSLSAIGIYAMRVKESLNQSLKGAFARHSLSR